VSLRLRALELNGRLLELLNSVVALRDGVGTGRDDAWYVGCFVFVFCGRDRLGIAGSRP